MMPTIRHCDGFIEVTTPGGKIEKVPSHRDDIARLLARGHAPAHPKAMTGSVVATTSTPRQAAALARAREAVTTADLVVARASPPMAGRPLTAVQAAAVNKMSNVTVLESVGRVVGRELAERDQRLNAIEAQLKRFAEVTRRDILARARRACMRAI